MKPIQELIMRPCFHHISKSNYTHQQDHNFSRKTNKLHHNINNSHFVCDKVYITDLGLYVKGIEFSWFT